MSLLNRASSGDHSIFVVLYRCLAQQGPMKRDRLLSLCCPERASRRDDVHKTLTKWHKLGLFVEDESAGTIGLAAPPAKNVGTDEIRHHARSVVMREDNNQDLFREGTDDGAVRAQDFTRAIAWLLAQDAYTCVLDRDAAAEMEESQFPGAMPLKLGNDVRWQGLVAWSRFLGFAWRDGKRLIADPTTAVRHALTTVFQGTRELDIVTFLHLLCSSLPVVDGGIYRSVVEEKLRECGAGRAQGWDPLPRGFVSTSLSRAIHRLVLEKVITLAFRSDATARQLLGRDGQVLSMPGSAAGAVTHVIYQGVM